MSSGPLAHAPWPHFDQEMIDAAASVLRSGRVNWWTGSECRTFEREWCDTFGLTHALAMANGSVSLEVALKALGIGPGDEVIVTPRSYVASASCVALVGATPIFADIDRRSQNLSAETIEAVITPRTKAIIPVHLYGWPCDMPAIMAVARRHGLKVIEDCAQAHGATIDDRPVGSFGDFASWSFCQDKIITTGGEGGMLTTANESLWKVAWSLSQHGKSWEQAMAPPSAPGFRWLIERMGSNYRMTEMQAAIGRVQLRRLPAWIAARQRNAATLRAVLEESPLIDLRWPSPREGHVFYRVAAQVRPEALAPGWSRDRIMTEISALGVPCFVGVCPEIQLECAFQPPGGGPNTSLPTAAEVGARSLAFLVHPTIDAHAMDACAAVVAQVLARAAKRAPARC
ncbi:MAG: DegT/DnrJ/EryC1/StrS aminotransferase family protein [Phycisphaeraceae bacterium]|nr:DegT/DnrJ/EryC1/StrS aminotransferase family protein [Phycisphaeraceae bacterium]